MYSSPFPLSLHSKHVDMKQKFFPVLMVVAMLVGCAGNKSKTTAEIDGITFDSVLVDTVCHLTSDTSSPAFNIKFSLQYAKGNNAQAFNDSLLSSGILMADYMPDGEKQDIPTVVNQFVEKAFNQYKEFSLPIYRDDPEHSQSLNNSYEVKTETRNGEGDVINYIATIYYYGGGAHGIDQTIVKNINAKTGKIFQLSDIFVPGYEKTLAAKLKDKLKDFFNVEDDEGLKEKIFADSLYVPDNFILGKDNITFIYNSDEIAAHAVGEICLDFAKSDLEEILQKE